MENTIICFHSPNEDNGYLSNWYSCKFMEKGVTYTSVEQYMMYNKAKLFKDDKVASKILATQDVGEIKALGRQVANFKEAVWFEHRYAIVYKGNLLKFKANKDLADKLKGTGCCLLCECAVHDRIWGIGLSMHDKDRFNPSKWRGTNYLGMALMEVRASL